MKTFQGKIIIFWKTEGGNTADEDKSLLYNVVNIFKWEETVCLQRWLAVQ